MKGERRPLNGTKTHPLTRHAVQVLRDIAKAPLPRQKVNAGVVDRLTREDLVEIVPMPSPFAIHRGGNIAHLRITEAGSCRLALQEDRNA
ncbi:hypothetical protein [Enterovirga sp. CN4-39]|uniref:hypothetical protein n=1 Tax=Enterovirga sp. CN4-39 TaxID=3400910 RepID=UPI003C0625B5